MGIAAGVSAECRAPWGWRLPERWRWKFVGDEWAWRVTAALSLARVTPASVHGPGPLIAHGVPAAVSLARRARGAGALAFSRSQRDVRHSGDKPGGEGGSWEARSGCARPSGRVPTVQPETPLVERLSWMRGCDGAHDETKAACPLLPVLPYSGSTCSVDQPVVIRSALRS